jgi:hypothetical protein
MRANFGANKSGHWPPPQWCRRVWLELDLRLGHSRRLLEVKRPLPRPTVNLGIHHHQAGCFFHHVAHNPAKNVVGEAAYANQQLTATTQKPNMHSHNAANQHPQQTAQKPNANGH